MKTFFTTILLPGLFLLNQITPSALAKEAASHSPSQESPAQKDARMKWWRDARFGMFIHWGVYSVPAGEWDGHKDYAEWFLEETHMPVSQYEKYADQFNPTNFNAVAWVRAAKAAGVKYIVITSKHHDGFAMYPSAFSDWCISRTPFHRDPLKELSAACKAEGIRFCCYYTIMDWHSSDWGVRRPWNDVAAKSGPPDMDRFEAYMKNQLKEILTRYGPLGLLWFDGNWESPWTVERGQRIYDYVRSIQPSVIVNNRVGKPENTAGGGFAHTGMVGDYGTPEQTIPPSGFGPGVDWESCMTMNNHWGYNKNDQNWKSAQTLIRNLIDCSSKGGNYLLNVGPTSEGLIPGPSLERLKEMGDWMKVNSPAIYKTSASPFSRRLPWGRCTMQAAGNTTTLFLHVFNWPADGQLMVPGLKNHIDKAYLLADKRHHSLAAKNVEDGVAISVPPNAENPISTTVVLKIKGPLVIDKIPEPKATASNVYENKTAEYGAQFAFDAEEGTRWATDDSTKQAWVAIDFLKPQTFGSVRISEAFAGRVQQFEFQFRDGTEWKTIFDGTTLGGNFKKTFASVTAQEFRLNILNATQGPTINEIELGK